MRSLNALPTTFLSLLSLTLAAEPAPNPDDLQIITTTPATCTRPTRPGDKISVHYIGTLAVGGTEFDASYNRNKPFTFTLGAGQVIQGWDEGLKEMCPGEARRLVVPSGMGYGAWGSPPVIPGGATLVFETLLVEIVGVDAGVVSVGGDGIEEGKTEAKSVVLSTQTTTDVGASMTEAGFTIATAPAEPTGVEMVGDKVEATPGATAALEATPLHPSATGSPTDSQEGECHLLGPFALLVQAALGVMALLSLVYKRWRETPKRPWKIWFFDVSKQVVGSVLLHVMNLLMSMLGAGDIEHASQTAASKSSGEDAAAAAAATQEGGRTAPNPCSYYLLNLLIDTTIGIAVLYMLLKAIHVAFSYTPLARPRESIKSGHYGHPPHPTWWLKQSLLYFIGLFLMKLFVLLLFLLLPWLPWVGDWMLRWTEGNEAVEIAFVMFIFPLAMNAIQYWIIDNFIMDKSAEGGEYERVGGDGASFDGEGEGEVEDARAKGGVQAGETERLVGGEGSRSGSRRGSPGRGASPRKERDD